MPCRQYDNKMWQVGKHIIAAEPLNMLVVNHKAGAERSA